MNWSAKTGFNRKQHIYIRVSTIIFIIAEYIKMKIEKQDEKIEFDFH
jgi:hypothetical protein